MTSSGLHRRTFVLIHGAYHGAWCWSEVADRLRELGHVVCTPTLMGLGERSHLLDSRPTLRMLIDDVASVIETEQLADVILVGHSFAGSVVSGIADRMPQRLSMLVYLDALVLFPDETPFDGLPIEVVSKYQKLADETSGGLSVPAPPPGYFGIVDNKMAAWMQDKLTPQPFGTYVSKLEIDNPLGNGVPATYVAATEPSFPSTGVSRDRAKGRGGGYLEMPTGHDVMLTSPLELVEMLIFLGSSST